MVQSHSLGLLVSVCMGVGIQTQGLSVGTGLQLVPISPLSDHTQGGLSRILAFQFPAMKYSTTPQLLCLGWEYLPTKSQHQFVRKDHTHHTAKSNMKWLGNK